MPSSQGVTPGLGGDDAFFMQINFPTGTTCNINVAIPSFYLGSTIPTNDFQTYDQVASIVNSPRTGTIKLTMNTFNDDSDGFGWVSLNDGSIGSSTSGATTRANTDTWPLYASTYCSVIDTYANVSGGRTAPGNTIAAAYTDFTANKAMLLTKQLGRVLAGIGMPSGGGSGTTWALGQFTGAEQQALTDVNQLPSHSHPGSSVTLGQLTNISGGGGSTVLAPPGSGQTPTVSVAAQGASTPFNIQNPNIYYKILMKL
jgi:hypothetical protein